MKKHHILVVDDEEGIQRVLQRILVAMECRVTTASDTVAARRHLRYHNFDLVLCDYLMPGENGLAFLQDLKRTYPKILRVMVTGNGDMKTVIEAVNQAQVHYYLTKPFEFATIRATVGELLRWAERKVVSGDRPFTTRQRFALESLRTEYPGIDEVHREPDGAILLDDNVDSFAKELPELLSCSPPKSLNSETSLLLDEEFHRLIEG